MNIISYSFFEPKVLHRHRDWDKFNTYDRYWYVLPALIAINSYVYPDFKIKFHISNNITQNKLYTLFEKCIAKYNLEVEIINREYDNTEPTIWRYKPLLEKECDVLLCRDIDSLPTTDEIKSTYYFINNEKYEVSTIRSHKNHKIPQTIMLAGLCAFRPKKIDLSDNFDIFLDKYSTSNWGVDQNYLIRTFTKDNKYTSDKFLDSRLNSKNHYIANPLIDCDSFDEEYYGKNVNIDLSQSVLRLLDSYTEWSGEPIDVRGEDLKNILSKNTKLKEMLTILESDKVLKEFYL
tara:strand:+ start:736 stop:1608 length:873 start_codon:yes stop_codon:yes gene_type:complete